MHSSEHLSSLAVSLRDWRRDSFVKRSKFTTHSAASLRPLGIVLGDYFPGIAPWIDLGSAAIGVAFEKFESPVDRN